MAAKTAAERAAHDPRLMAMLKELGTARLDDLPMEDGESGKRRHDPRNSVQNPKSINDPPCVMPRIPIKSAWAKAMQRGDFDDDDAAKVSGIDPMADGQLARARRNQAAATATSHDNQEKNVPRDRNGFVPPHATAGVRGKRKGLGPVHVGDGPIDIHKILSRAVRDRQPHPARDPVISMGSTGRGAFAGALSSPSSAHPQSTAAKASTQKVQATQAAAKSQVRLVLPDGASIALQLPATLAAAVFPKTSQKFCGKVYLISGFQSSENLIILTVEDSRIPEIRHSISQYDTYLSVSSTGLMLKFNDSEGGFNFYGVEFDNALNMKSFIQTLKELVDRSKLSIQSVATSSTAEDLSNAGDATQPAVKMESHQHTPALPTKDAELAAGVEQKAAVSLHENEDSKDGVGRSLTEPQIEKLSEASYGLGQTVTDPRPVRDVPVSGESVPSEAHGVRVRTDSSLVVTAAPKPTDTSSATHLSPMSKPEEPEPVASWVTKAEFRLLKPVEKRHIQTFDAPMLAKSLSLSIDNHDIVKQAMSHTAQAASSPVKQTQAPVAVSSETLNEIIEMAWDVIRYMQDSDPERFSFDTMRTLIGASCAAVIGRGNPSFRKLQVAEQRKFIADHAQASVENVISCKIKFHPSVASEIATVDVDQARKTETRGAVKAPASASSMVYGIEELMSIRSSATEIDPGKLSNIPRRPSNMRIPQPKQGLPRVPISAQVQRAAAANSNWL